MGIVMTDWKEEAINYRDFRHSDRPEDWEDVKHRRKHSKGCKRNKGGPHDYQKVIKTFSWSTWSYAVLECSKCGKNKWIIQ
jgi:hypothetical protein